MNIPPLATAGTYLEAQPHGQAPIPRAALVVGARYQPDGELRLLLSVWYEGRGRCEQWAGYSPTRLQVGAWSPLGIR
jgi:hypothetical protein